MRKRRQKAFPISGGTQSVGHLVACEDKVHLDRAPSSWHSLVKPASSLSACSAQSSLRLPCGQLSYSIAAESSLSTTVAPPLSFDPTRLLGRLVAYSPGWLGAPLCEIGLGVAAGGRRCPPL
eukprot:154959-Pleurochrysis_carterae.AAC.3